MPPPAIGCRIHLRKFFEPTKTLSLNTLSTTIYVVEKIEDFLAHSGSPGHRQAI